MELIASSATRQQIDFLISKPPHAVCIFAPTGSGKKFTARYIACQLLITNEPTPSQLYIVRPNEKGVITIEQARGVLEFTKLKSHSRKSINRLIIIEDAQLMTTESQNALLKLVEEPPTDTIIILTAPNQSSLLKTINSRAASLKLNPAPKAEVQAHYPNVLDADFNKAWLLSGGRIGLLNSIITDSENDTLVYIAYAKRILQASTDERLMHVEQVLKKDIPAFLDALLLVAKAGRNQAIAKNTHPQAQKWQSIIKYVLNAQENLRHNPNQKLLLTSLMLEL